MAPTDSPYKLARALRSGRTVCVGWCTWPSPPLVEAMAREGLDGVVLDQQHGQWDTAATIDGLAGVYHGGAAPVVRIPLGDFASAARALDCGAEAIIAPMINTADDAEALVAATKYPPIGARSWGPFRAMSLTGISDANAFLAAANEVALVFAMIETKTALDNVEAIAATAGIDGLFVGPYDLSVALSDGAHVDPHTQSVAITLDRVLAAAKKCGKFAGIYCASGEQVRAAAVWGFQFLSIGADGDFLRAGVASRLVLLHAT
jgi:4-hydroxy-2-oxoheptanedioate aldolase